MPHPVPSSSGDPCLMNVFNPLEMTLDALWSQPSMGITWPQAMKLADYTAPPSATARA